MKVRMFVPFLIVLALTVSASSVARAGTGACCLECDIRWCLILTEEECANEPGYYLGDGSTCEECPNPSELPDPALSSVEPADIMNGLFVCPANPTPIPASQCLVTVRNNCNQVVPNAFVLVRLTEDNPVCAEAVLQGTTDELGQLVLTLAASGCRHNVGLSGIVKVNGITIRSYSNVKSPDWDADGRVALPDLQQFAREFLGQSNDGCHDYDNTGSIGLPDLVLFGTAFSNANHCVP